MNLSKRLVVFLVVTSVLTIIETFGVVRYLQNNFVVSNNQIILEGSFPYFIIAAIILSGMILAFLITSRITQSEAGKNISGSRNQPGQGRQGNRQSGKGKRQQQEIRDIEFNAESRKPAARASGNNLTEQKKTGNVKWFNGSKGYGFITNPEGDDVFVHYKAIKGNRRMLYRGQEVEYIETIENDKLQAIDVEVHEEA